MGHRQRPVEIAATDRFSEDLHRMMSLAVGYLSQIRVGTPHYSAVAALCSAIAETHRAVLGDGPPPWGRPNTPPAGPSPKPDA